MAEKTRLVMIAADESEHSSKAIDWYAEDLHRPGYKVLVLTSLQLPQLYVSELPEMYGSENLNTWEGAMEEQNRKVKEIQQSFIDKLAAKGVTDVSTKVVQGGRPGESIVEEAEKTGAMMIVMGTRGMGTIRRTIMGSVSDYVVHHANCPVVVCRH